MIPFLVKLANLLDNRGQYSMAREVDDLIEKLAQVSTSESFMANRQKAYKTLDDFSRVAERMSQVSSDPQKSLEQASDLVSELSKLYNEMQDDDEVKGVLTDSLTALNQIAGGSAQEAQLPDLWSQAAQVLGRKSVPQDSVSSKVPAKKPMKHRKNPLVSGIEQLLGLKPTGTWNAGLNRIFSLYMMNNHPDKLKDGKFVGNLQEAYDLIKLDKGKLPKEDEPAPKPQAAPKPASAPAAPSKLKSKYDLLDVQDEINRLRTKGGWGDEQIQALIGLATDAADKTPGDAAKKSESFERNFKQMGRYRVR